jgi:DNA-binding MarR family transcriptional regulator
MEVNSAPWSIVRDLHRAAQLQRRAAAGSALGPVALGLLNLAGQAPVRPSEAAAELDVLPQSISRAVAELAARGMVRRVGDEADGRSYVVELTEQGRAELDRFRDELSERFARHLDGWTEAEVRTFAGQLSRLVSALAADLPEPPTAPTPKPWRSR